MKKQIGTKCVILLLVCCFLAGCMAEEIPEIVRNTPGSGQLENKLTTAAQTTGLPVRRVRTSLWT